MTTYEITISGRGVELTVGSISPEAYEFWIEQEPDALNNHIFGSPYDEDDEDNLVPNEDDDRFIGYWYEIDDVAHIIAAVKDYGYVTVTDEDNNVVYELDLATHDDIQIDEDIEIDDLETGKYLESWSNEKGTFFVGTITVDNFDPDKLTIRADKINNEIFINGITYDNEHVEDEGSDTTGKGYNYQLWDVV